MLLENHQLLYDKQPQWCLSGKEGPFKNPFCPYYEECLSRAAQENWPQFSCFNCRFQKLYEDRLADSSQIVACYRLLERVFKLD